VLADGRLRLVPGTAVQLDNCPHLGGAAG